MYSYAVRTHDTLDAVDTEQQLLALNVPVSGVLSDQFVCGLERYLQTLAIRFI